MKTQLIVGQFDVILSTLFFIFSVLILHNVSTTAIASQTHSLSDFPFTVGIRKHPLNAYTAFSVYRYIDLSVVYALQLTLQKTRRQWFNCRRGAERSGGISALEPARERAVASD